MKIHCIERSPAQKKSTQSVMMPSMKIIMRAGVFIASLVKGLWSACDIRDVFVFGGLVMLGYGLYLRWGQWLAFMVCGALLVLLGLGWLTREQKEGQHGDH